MSRSARVTRFFGDRDYDFALEIDQLEELQEITDAGLGDTLERIERLFVKDIKQVLRLGLIGGAGDLKMINGRPVKDEAYRLVLRHCVSGEMGSCAEVAMAVANRAIAGVKDEPMGEQAGERTEILSPEERSGSQPSTEPEPLSDTLPPKSGDAPSGNSGQRLTGGQKPTARTTKRQRRRQTSTTKT